MTYVITGATSFIGIALTQYLLKQGEQVIAVCRPDSKGLNQLPREVRIVYADMADYRNLHREIAHADVFIHMAWAGTGHDGRDIADIQSDNVKYATEALLSAEKMGCSVFVGAGSQAEYGETHEPQREDAHCEPFSAYGQAKLKFKDIAFDQTEHLRIKYIHLRIFSLYGERDHPWTLIMSSVEKLLKNEPVALSSCTQNWNFLYVEDAVQKIVALIEYALHNNRFKHEIYNIASRDTRVLREYIERVRVLTGSKSELQYGAIQPEHLVSLQPDMHKTETAIGQLPETAFDDIIKKIIKSQTI